MELYQEDRELVRKRPALWQGYALSGWLRRAGAALTDGLILVVLWPLAGLLVGISPDELFSEYKGDVLPAREDLLSTAASALAALVYLPPVMKITNGATAGKWLTRIRVVRTDEQPMSLTRAAWREVALKTVAIGLFPLISIVLLPLNYLWPLWDPQNRAIHDMLGGTRVVRSDVPRHLREP